MTALRRHPQLDTDEKRLKAMASDNERAIYKGVVHRRFYGNTTERGKFGEARRARAEFTASRTRADFAPAAPHSQQTRRRTRSELAENSLSTRRYSAAARSLLGAARRLGAELGAALAMRRRAQEGGR